MFVCRARRYVAAPENDAGGTATQKHAGGPRWHPCAGDASAASHPTNCTSPSATTDSGATGASVETADNGIYYECQIQLQWTSHKFN